MLLIMAKCHIVDVDEISYYCNKVEIYTILFIEVNWNSADKMNTVRS